MKHIVPLLFLALPTQAETVNLLGTTITLQDSARPAAVAEIRVYNTPNNGAYHDGTYPMSHNGLSLTAQFIWNFEGRNDAVIVTPPDGYSCDPVDCMLSLPESTGGTIYLFSLEGVGM